MPNFAPVLFQLLSESSGWPALQGVYLPGFAGYQDLVERLGAEFAAVAEAQRGFLVPVSMGDWLERGCLGTPVLTPNEVDDYVEGARRERRPGDWQPAGTSCWRLVPTSHGLSALFPDAGSYEPTFDVAVSFRTSPGLFQLGRLSLPWPRMVHEAVGLATGGDEQASVDRDACKRVALDRREPGRTYVGRCEPTDCDGPCSELLYIVYDTGETILDGCQCGQR